MRVIKQNAHVICKLPSEEIMRSIEVAGRVCYKSEDRITEDSAEKFVRRLIQSGHESVIEHINVSAVVICDRGVSHEIVRHRLASYSQESTRYCNYTRDKFGGEIAVIDPRSGIELDSHMKNLPQTNKDLIFDTWVIAMNYAENAYHSILELGATPQIARGVLPTALKTEMVMTMNLREWRHFLKVRTDKAAHPQIREVALQLLSDFKSYLPVVFEDVY